MERVKQFTEEIKKQKTENLITLLILNSKNSVRYLLQENKDIDQYKICEENITAIRNELSKRTKRKGKNK